MDFSSITMIFDERFCEEIVEFLRRIMARLSRQKSDDFIVNQAAAFAASSNMAGKYASAGGMSPIAEWQRS